MASVTLSYSCSFMFLTKDMWQIYFYFSYNTKKCEKKVDFFKKGVLRTFSARFRVICNLQCHFMRLYGGETSIYCKLFFLLIFYLPLS